jgi:hypothetical protein
MGYSWNDYSCLSLVFVHQIQASLSESLEVWLVIDWQSPLNLMVISRNIIGCIKLTFKSSKVLGPCLI